MAFMSGHLEQVGATTMAARRLAACGRFLFVALAAVLVLSPVRLSAQTCGTDHVLRQGDTLADIARKVYGSPGQWSVIYYANQDRLGENATLLVPGLAIKIPCIGAPAKPVTPAAVSPAPAPSQGGAEQPAFQLSSMLKRIELLTAEGYPPFTGRSLPEGGLVVDLLQSSLNLVKAQSKGTFDFRVSWVNDWAAHLNPLLITRALDAGFPWSKPDCADFAALDRTSQYKCQKFFFSDPFYESVTVLFVRNDASFTFEKDEQIIGKTLCRTKGWSSNDLDKGGRNWLKDEKVTLMQPQTVEECFRLLDQGTVDAVVTGELTGQAVAAGLGMADRVHAASRPLSIETLHVIIAKTHPHARTVLYYINSSLAKLKEAGTYDAIVTKHLELFWDAGGNGQPTASPPATDTQSGATVSSKPDDKRKGTGGKVGQP
jgi:polar amino acid transport system substrate-binding protein